MGLLPHSSPSCVEHGSGGESPGSNDAEAVDHPVPSGLLIPDTRWERHKLLLNLNRYYFEGYIKPNS